MRQNMFMHDSKSIKNKLPKFFKKFIFLFTKITAHFNKSIFPHQPF